MHGGKKLIKELCIKVGKWNKGQVVFYHNNRFGSDL